MCSAQQVNVRMAQGKLGDVDAETIETRLNEITDKFNRAKQHIADQKAKLDAEQREADDLKAQADDAVRARPFPAACASHTAAFAYFTSISHKALICGVCSSTQDSAAVQDNNSVGLSCLVFQAFSSEW